MKTATIIRQASDDEGTFGHLVSDDGHLKLCTLELPWRDNTTGHSCIPLGSYQAVWHLSPSKGWVYLLQDTAPRSNVLVHSANFAGDVDKGWQSQLLGCIALGMSTGSMANASGHQQRALLSSRDACAKFYDWGSREPVMLHIVRQTGVSP